MFSCEDSYSDNQQVDLFSEDSDIDSLCYDIVIQVALLKINYYTLY